MTSNRKQSNTNHNHEERQDPRESPEKAVASIPLDIVVIAYLRVEQEKLAIKLKEAEEDKQKSGEQMVAQLNRILGQKEGAIEQIKLQIEAIRAQLQDDEKNKVHLREEQDLVERVSDYGGQGKYLDLVGEKEDA